MEKKVKKEGEVSPSLRAGTRGCVTKLVIKEGIRRNLSK
jgi:hypothetical protein